MSDEMSADEYRNQKPAKMSKYRNVKVEVDNIRFDSKAEAERYWDLKQLERAGEISDLELQPAYPLLVQGVKIAVYKADFRYVDGEGEIVVEDVKSEATKTPVYRLKKKHIKAQYGIDIVEITRGRAA